MMRITEPAAGIYKIEVPFETLYTSVFAVRVGEGYVLIDSATTADDVDGVILPALREIGLAGAPQALLLTHGHSDHAGGAARLGERFPGLPVCALEPIDAANYRALADGEVVGERLQVVHLPGHTRFSVGYLDLPTGTLLAGDCLQQQVVGKYTNGVGDPVRYLASIARLRGMGLRRILASHDYVPLGCLAEGSAAIAAYLAECERPWAGQR